MRRNAVSAAPNVRKPFRPVSDGKSTATSPHAAIVRRYAMLRRFPKYQWPPWPRDSRYAAINPAFSSLSLNPFPIVARRTEALRIGVFHESLSAT
jgi:hypothetical protein